MPCQENIDNKVDSHRSKRPIDGQESYLTGHVV